MLDDFTPIIHTLEGRTIKLWPIGDVHIGAKECALDEFQKFLDSKVSKDPDAYVLICGDVLNNGLRSSSCPTDIYAETLSPSGQVDKAVELLQPVADKILAGVGGNHEKRSLKSVDLDPLFAVFSMLRRSDGSSLQDVYRSNVAFIRIRLKKGSARDQYGIMLTHGKTANKRKQFTNIVEGVDATVYAHTHTPDVLIPTRIRFGTNNRITTHEVVNITCCSWLKEGGYGLSNLYLPQSTARPQCLLLEFTNTNNRAGCIRVGW